MTKGQKTMTVALARPELSTRKAGSVFGVSFGNISKARQVLEEAAPDLADQVLAGTTPLNEAYGIISDRRKEVERLATKREQLRTGTPGRLRRSCWP